MGGTLHPMLNIHGNAIAKKYREGKVQRTLKRECNQRVKLPKGNPSIWDAMGLGQQGKLEIGFTEADW